MMAPQKPGESQLLAETDERVAKAQARRGTVITLGILGALIVLIVLLTPVTDTETDTRLTTEKYGPGNARLLYDLAARLGWRVQRSDTTLLGRLDTTAIYAVFDGPTTPTREERRVLLEAVQRGASLLVAPTSDGAFPLLDSLGLYQGRVGLVQRSSLGGCPKASPIADPLSQFRVRTRMVTFDTLAEDAEERRRRKPYPVGAWTLLASDVDAPDSLHVKMDIEDDTTKASVAPRAAADTSRLVRPATEAERDSRKGKLTAAEKADTVSRAVESMAVLRPDTGKLAMIVAPKTVPLPTMVAFPLGRGRVVALADPDVFRTEQLRDCDMGAAQSAVRALEYLSNGGRRTIVFSEYHQRLRTDGPGVVLREWLIGSALGRVVLTLMAAAILLIMARGRRTLAPVYRAREERRSALEHVDALATAWQAVRGTRTVARLLARGIRRRHAAGRWRALDDAAFLAALAERHPRIAGEVTTLTQAIDTPVAPTDLPALRRAAAHIDAECLTP